MVLLIYFGSHLVIENLRNENTVSGTLSVGSDSFWAPCYEMGTSPSHMHVLIGLLNMQVPPIPIRFLGFVEVPAHHHAPNHRHACAHACPPTWLAYARVKSVLIHFPM